MYPSLSYPISFSLFPDVAVLTIISPPSFVYLIYADTCTPISLAHRSFVNAWQTSMRIHEQLGDNRIRFGQRLSEMSDELATLAKEVDKNRKQVRRVAIRVRFSVSPLPLPSYSLRLYSLIPYLLYPLHLILPSPTPQLTPPLYPPRQRTWRPATNAPSKNQN